MEPVTVTQDIVSKYVDDVLSGKIVACKSIIGACQRHVDDLAKQNTDEFPYYYDESHADRIVRFFPAMVHPAIRG